jgi:hypothetical protein
MPEFMIMVVGERALAPEETRALVDGRAAYERRLRAVSAWVDGGRLRPSAGGRRVRVRDDRAQVEAGPFEHSLDAYVIVRADDLEAAHALAQECPKPPGAVLEVRPVRSAKHCADKCDQQGRTFAFGVLGSAADEPGWVDVMDRMDAASRFPEGRWQGGVRLHPPVRTGGHRTFFDGPFLESKEVIGGIFFLRFATLEEAVEWARQTELVRLGALEIRELWRS